MPSSFFLLWSSFILFSSNIIVLTETRANKTNLDRESLLCFKSGISSDPLGILNPWLNTSFNFCSWPGVTCGNGLRTRVVSLDLSSSDLGGQISGCIGNLTSLWRINLADNRLTGAIPEELGRLPQLQTLMLVGNRLEGNIPNSLGTSFSVSYVNLANNSLTGGIPYSLASSSSLRTLILSRNNFNGESLFTGPNIPLGMDISHNNFTGKISEENHEFKALIFKFMVNGSLERWLHSEYYSDHDMTARLGDFGSAKFLFPDLVAPKSLVEVGGTIGYMVPEYAMGSEISTRGDVYSFGVLLLEMLTGKQPTDGMFVDGLNLHNFTESMYPDRIADILDPHMVHEEEQQCAEPWMQSYITPLVALGLSCSIESPRERPGMQYVCVKLSAIKEAFLESHG
ncbi:hypothetical protein PR202_ga20379 [Eleusine coracana subsp. coracana]|uniref:Protein kinase domain-containing protein n=1 Tax=Eleusine coracana subsp. coracana TaxID=191504 RepID=A0AAV5CWH5_ELECO|nr:hypothetical protein PR202_ga20379 [Eleusine coracana subsp. coracana]